MKFPWLFALCAVYLTVFSAPLYGQGTGGFGGGTGGTGASSGFTQTGNTGGGGGTGGSGGASSADTGGGLANSSGFTQLQNNGAGASAADIRTRNTNGLSAAAGAGGTGGGGFGGGGGGGGLGGLGLGGLGFGGLGQGFGGSSASNQPAVRTRLRSGISVQPLQSNAIQYSAQSRFYQAPTALQMGGVRVNMNGGDAVISGVVRSEKDRRMSELLMRLEPGVRNVSNRVIVSP